MLRAILILTLLFSRIFAQEIILKGYIIDEEHNPVKNSLIELIQNNSFKTTISDSLGFFSFKINPGEVKIITKHLGYNQFEKTFKILSDTLLFIQLSSRVIKFNEVTVTATRYQANTAEISSFVEIVNIEMIKKTSSISLTDILKNTTSIYVRDYGGTPAVLKTISLRGTGSEHTVFLLNGMRISSYQNGIFDLSLMPSHVIERIEIIHSNLSSLYGADAVGGVVNIITRRENENKIAEINFAFDSFGLKKLNTNVSGTLKTLSYFSSFSRTYGPGSFKYKYKLADKYLILKRKNAHFNISDLYLNISNDNFMFSTFYIRSNRGIPAQVTKYDPSSTATQLDEDFNLLISTSKTLSSFILKGTLMFKNSYLRYINNDLLIAGSGIDSYSHNLFYTANLNTIFAPNSNLILSSGVETSLGMAEGNSFGRAKRFNLAFFLSGEGKINPGFLPEVKIYPMLRNDYFSDFGNKIVYKLGINSQILKKPSLNLKFSYGTGFRAPTFNDLYWPGSGNKNLKPEESKGYDAGLIMIVEPERKSSSGLKIEISFFNIDIKDRIVWLPSQENQNIWKPINIDHVNSSGIEVSGDVNLFNKLTISGNFSIAKSIRKNKRAQDDATQNKYLIYIPNSTGNIRTELSLGKLFLLVQANYVGLRYTTETNDRGLQPYFVVDLTCGITYGNQFFDGGIKFSVKNLFNENYETMVGYPMPLRSFLIELSLAIKNKQKQKGEIK